MILNKDEVKLLEEIISYDESLPENEPEEDCVICYRKPYENCKFFSICKKYGSFAFVEGAREIVRDLFDTIKNMG